MSETNTTFEELERLAGSDGWVRRLAQKLVADPGMADDVVQESYLAALQNPDGDRKSLRAWLSGVVHRVALARLRSEGRRRELEQLAQAGPDPVSTADKVAMLEQQDVVIRALVGLQDPYREALILRFVDGLAPREIAAQLKTPIATVNSRLARGLGQLRSQLDASHGGDRTQWLTALTPLFRAPTGPASLTLGTLLLKSKSIVVAAGVLLALLGCFIVLGELPGDEIDPPLGRQVAKSVAEPEQASPAFQEVGQPSRAEVAASPDSNEVEAGSTLRPPAEQPSAGVDLLVVLPSGAPAVGAAVLRLDYNDSSWFELLQLPSPLAPPDLPSHMEWFQADEKGLVRLADTPAGFGAVAFLNGQWAAMRVPPQPERSGELSRLELATPSAVEVRALDRSSSPLPGVRVTCEVLRRGKLVGGRCTIELDAGGRGRLERIRLLAAELAHADHLQFEAKLMMEEIEVTLDLGIGPAQEVLLEFPTSGEVIVRLLDESGEPVSVTATKVRLTEEGGSYRPTMTVAMEEGSGSVRGLAPGERHTIRGFDGNLSSASQSIVAPEVGGVLRVDLVLLPTRGLVVRGRLRNQAGEALEGQTFSVRGSVRTQKRFVGLDAFGHTGTTDTEGAFEVPCGILLRDQERVREIWWEVLSTEPNHTPLYGVVQVELDSVHGPIVDLGDIEFAGPPFVLGGRVVSPEGAPIPGVALELLVPQSVQNGESPVDSFGVQKLQRLSIDGVHTETDQDGAFAFYWEPDGRSGDAAPQDFVLLATAPGLFQRSHPVGAGSLASRGRADVRIVMEEAGSLEGTLLADAVSSSNALSVRLIPSALALHANDPEPIWSFGRSRRGVTGKWELGVALALLQQDYFRWSSVPKGEYSLQVFHANELVREIHNLQVRAGEVCTDPRLFGIDPLPDRESLALKVLGMDGAPIDKGRVWVRSKQEWELLTDFRFGEAVIRPAHLPVNLLITALDHADLHVDGVSSDSTVTLPAPLVVRMIIDTPPDLMEGDHLVLKARRQGDFFGWPGEGNTRGKPVVVTTGAEAHLKLPGPGTYTVSVGMVWSPGDWVMTELYSVTYELSFADSGSLIHLAAPVEPVGD